MSGFGILSFGAYLPQRRLQRAAVHAANAWFAGGLKGLAKGERSIANWDEDPVTMAVEAARDCLAGRERAGFGAITLASTTLPFADRLNAGIVKEALNLDDAIGASDAGGSQRAGLTALLDALRGSRGRLVVAAERRLAKPASEGEMLHGDGAAAMLVGHGEPIAVLVHAHSVTADFVDHFRMAGEDFDYGWESRWVRDEGYTKLLGSAVTAALKQAGIAAASIDRFIVPVTLRGVPEGLAKRAGIRPEAVSDTLGATVGDTGAAHPLLLLAAALEQAKPGETIMVAAFGQGADVLILRVTEANAARQGGGGVAQALARRRPCTNYMRFLFHRGLLDLDRGMRAEFDQKQPGTTLWRNRKAVLGLVGGRCTKTGTVQFPKSDISVNPNDHAVGTQEDYPLAELPARIVTYTADSLTYSPDPPSYYGIVDFDGGGRMMAEFTDCAAEDVAVGREVRMMFRIKAIDERRHFVKYFWKAVPVA